MTRPYSAEHLLNYKTAFFSLTKLRFTRTWIIQEMVLAKEMRLMFQGNIFDKAQFDQHLSLVTFMLEPSKQQEMTTIEQSTHGFMNYHKMKQIQRLW
jgi:hypothetical protein